MVRTPAVAGMFYEADSASLIQHINKYAIQPAEKYKAMGVVSPHAGYVYSGDVAGAVFSSIEIPDLIIILGPNHTGLGEQISVMNKGAWRTPLGDVKINENVANEIIEKCKYAESDAAAHTREHSIEVQLPFLQVLKKSFTFVPICLAEPDLDNLKNLAKAIAETIKEKNALIVASSDLTHYEPAKQAKEKDMRVMNAIEALDPEKMITEVEKGITMCGWMPVYTMLHACKLLGAKKGKIIKYMNSGETSGDFSSVVGYGGAVVL
jgi:MEMO1 family protein